MARLSRNIGVTPSERYLDSLCQQTFLSLWSHPKLYKSDDKELCDLLVIFGNDIIMFSDKYCDFPSSADLALAWKRWFKRAVIKSAHQAWGAERWIRSFPTKIFLDANRTQQFPLSIPDPVKTRFHIIVVAHGASQACKKHFGGSGSFMIRSEHAQQLLANSTREEAETDIFMIPDLDSHKTFVHVLDDTTLDIVLKTLDTAPDFIKYLNAKERLMRAGPFFAAGEEELLGVYIADEVLNEDYGVSIASTFNVLPIFINEGWWKEITNRSSWKAKREADKVSYMWDDLVDGFHKRGTTETNFPDVYQGCYGVEVSMRIMAEVECPAILVPVEMRQTGMRGAWHGTRKETYGGTDCKFAAAD